MATKAELLEKAKELGVEGVDESNTAKQIQEAIAAKTGEGKEGGEENGEDVPEGFVQVVLKENVKLNGAYRKAGETVTLTPADRDALVTKGLAHGEKDA